MGPGQRKPWDDGDTKGAEPPPERTGIHATAARRLSSPFPTVAEAILSWMSHGPHWLRFDDDLPVYDRSSTALQLIALVAAAFFLLGGLTACPSRARRDFPDSLIVPPRARKVQYGKYHGADQVRYKIEIDYPADEILSLIAATLKSKGWQPLEEDFLNPGLPSSHVAGWTEFGDITTHPETTVRQWLAQWENATHDVVWYALRYTYPTGQPPDLHTLQVHASYYPADMVKQAKRITEKLREKEMKRGARDGR